MIKLWSAVVNITPKSVADTVTANDILQNARNCPELSYERRKFICRVHGNYNMNKSRINAASTDPLQRVLDELAHSGCCK